MMAKMKETVENGRQNMCGVMRETGVCKYDCGNCKVSLLVRDKDDRPIRVTLKGRQIIDVK